MMALHDDLARDEGLRLLPYDDATGRYLKTGDTIKGNITIGIGRNLQDRGLSPQEVGMLLENDIEIVRRELAAKIPDLWYLLPDKVQDALLNMAFNMGVPRLMKFRKMWAALKFSDYEKAAIEALDSNWASQVGDRANRIAHEIRSG
jgi:lysozyme